MGEIITEAAVRQLRFRDNCSEIVLQADDELSLEALEYIQEIGLPTKRLAAASHVNAQPINYDIKPLVYQTDKPRFTNALTGETYSEKPEHLTHLRGTRLVIKNHPLIHLRGQLDSLEAQILLLAVQTQREGRLRLAKDLEELLLYARAIMKAEVTEQTFVMRNLLGMDAAMLRQVSHNPQTYFSQGHILPSLQISRIGANLNALRTKVREVELAAADAFLKPNGSCERPDLILALNRMSSAVYIMMFYDIEGRYGDKD